MPISVIQRTGTIGFLLLFGSCVILLDSCRAGHGGATRNACRPSGLAEYAALFRPTGDLILEQSSHILFRQRRADASVAIEQAVGQRALSSLEFIHLLLDRTGG